MLQFSDASLTSIVTVAPCVCFERLNWRDFTISSSSNAFENQSLHLPSCSHISLPSCFMVTLIGVWVYLYHGYCYLLDLVQIVPNNFKTELREENHRLLFAPVPVIYRMTLYVFKLIDKVRVSSTSAINLLAHFSRFIFDGHVTRCSSLSLPRMLLLDLDLFREFFTER